MKTEFGLPPCSGLFWGKIQTSRLPKLISKICRQKDYTPWGMVALAVRGLGLAWGITLGFVLVWSTVPQDTCPHSFPRINTDVIWNKTLTMVCRYWANFKASLLFIIYSLFILLPINWQKICVKEKIFIHLKAWQHVSATQAMSSYSWSLECLRKFSYINLHVYTNM